MTRTLGTSDARIHYSISGSGPHVLVLIHGWGCQRSAWDGVLAAVPDSVTALAIDLPAFGESTATRSVFTMAAYAEDVAAVMREERITAATVVGHSMGGAVALELARSHPDLVGRVIGVDTFHYLQVYPKQEQAEIDGFLSGFRIDLPAGLDALIEMSSIASTPDSVKDEIRAQGLAARQPDAMSALEQTLLWDLDEALTAVTVPVSVLASAELLSDEAVARYGDRITVVPVPGISHYMPQEDPVGTTERILALATG